MAKNKKNKTEQMLNDLYNEVTRLKMENEKLRNMYAHNSAADTSTIDDAEFEDVDVTQPKPKKQKKLEDFSKQDQKIIKFASRFAKKLGLDDEDLDEIKEDLANNDDELRKKKFMDKLERKVVEVDTSQKLADIEAMKLAGKEPIDILSHLYGYDLTKDEHGQKMSDDKIVNRLMAKMRQEAFGGSIQYGLGGLRF